MKLEYNPRNFLRLIPTPLLQEYFEQRKQLQNLDWEGLGGHNIEPIYDAWMALPPEARQGISIDFQNATDLASKHGIQTLLDVGCSYGLDLVPVMGGVKTNVEKVLLVLLENPRIFWIASQFSWADGLRRYWQRRRDLPQAVPDLSPEARQELKKAISTYYLTNQGRGEYCEIEVYPRNGAHYFMVYLADYPSAVMCFENSDQLKRSTQQQAFDVVFILDDKKGTLDLYAEGRCQLRADLGQMFAKHILRQDVSLNTALEPAFDLDRLKDPNFRFAIDPSDGIKAMRLQAMCFSAPSAGGARIAFATPPRSKDWNLHEFMHRGLNSKDLPLEELHVEQATIQAVFLQGNPRPKSVTFSLTANNTCNLKDTPEHVKIRDCLKRSGVICE